MIILDKPHRFAVMNICWLAVIVAGSISFYLQNEIWIRICQAAIITFAIYGFYLSILFMYEYIREEAWRKYQEELNKLKYQEQILEGKRK